MKFTLNLFAKWFAIITITSVTTVYTIKSEIYKKTKRYQIEVLQDSLSNIKDSLSNIYISYEESITVMQDSLLTKTSELDSIQTVLTNIRNTSGMINISNNGYVLNWENNGIYYYVNYRGVKYKIESILFYPNPNTMYSHIYSEVVYMWNDPTIDYESLK